MVKKSCYFANQEEENLEWNHPRFSFYVAISSVVILIFLFFCERPFARTVSNRWPDHSLPFHYLYLYKYIYKNTADDMSALWTRHRRYRFILWVFLCGSGISVSSVRIRLHCKHYYNRGYNGNKHIVNAGVDARRAGKAFIKGYREQLVVKQHKKSNYN